MVELNRIAEIIQTAAPLETQEGWDNSGWQLCLDKSKGSDVNKILVTLELNEDVVTEAIDSDVQLIVCHHPLIFGGIKSVEDKKANSNGCKNKTIIHFLYSSHQITFGSLLPKTIFSTTGFFSYLT